MHPATAADATPAWPAPPAGTTLDTSLLGSEAGANPALSRNCQVPIRDRARSPAERTTNALEEGVLVRLAHRRLLSTGAALDRQEVGMRVRVPFAVLLVL